MSKMQRRKGYRVENEIVKDLLEAGVEAKRVPLSGAVEGYKGDIKILGSTFLAEVKARKRGAGFRVIEGWLSNNDFLFLKRDRSDPIIVLPWKTFVKLLKKEH